MYQDKSNAVRKGLAAVAAHASLTQVETAVVLAVGELPAYILAEVYTAVEAGIKLAAEKEAAFKEALANADFTEAKALLASGKRIDAVRKVRELVYMGLKEAVDIVDSWPEMETYRALKRD